MSNIRQDFIKARNTLATHRGPIKDRVIAAGRCGISIYDAENLPSDLVEDYKELVAKLTQGPYASGDGAIEQTVNAMNEDDAIEIAQQIMGFTTNLLNTPRSEFS